MRARAWLLLGSALPGVGLAAGCDRALCDGLAVELAATLAGLSNPLRIASNLARAESAIRDDRAAVPAELDAVPAELDAREATAGSGASSTAFAAPQARSANRAGVRAAAGVPRGLSISAARVLELAGRRAMPSGQPVPASDEHPAGLRLQGVAALGVGLRDGDILTRAAGVPASSVAAVVQAVLAARGRHAAEIDGQCYREGHAFQIRVEQPYPRFREVSAPPAGPALGQPAPPSLDEAG